MKFRSLIVAGVAVSALAAAPAAMAGVGDQLISGVGGTSLSINASTPVVFGSLFAPGSTYTGTGTVSAISTSPTWTLNVKDGTGDGHMQKANGVDLSGLSGLGLSGLADCSKSEAELAQAPSISPTGLPATGVTTHTVSLSHSDQALANATTALLPLTVLTTNFSQTIGSTESIQATCAYQVTATYTMSAS
jgi:hypothetical protein